MLPNKNAISPPNCEVVKAASKSGYPNIWCVDIFKKIWECSSSFLSWLRFMKVGKVKKNFHTFLLSSSLIHHLIGPWKWGFEGFRPWAMCKNRLKHLIPILTTASDGWPWWSTGVKCWGWMNFTKIFVQSFPLARTAWTTLLWCSELWFVSSGSTIFQQSTLPILPKPTHFTPVDLTKYVRDVKFWLPWKLFFVPLSNMPLSSKPKFQMSPPQPHWLLSNARCYVPRFFIYLAQQVCIFILVLYGKKCVNLCNLTCKIVYWYHKRHCSFPYHLTICLLFDKLPLSQASLWCL